MWLTSITVEFFHEISFSKFISFLTDQHYTLSQTSHLNALLQRGNKLQQSL